ncbi:MAG: 6-phosphogluconolactonase [Microbacteriaceae bacterium]
MDRIVVLPERSDVERAVATDVLVELARAIADRGRADIVLTGGTVGIGSLAAIADHPDRDEVDWADVRVWWGDERFVASGNQDRNEGQATDVLLQHLPLSLDHVFRFPAADGLTLDAARDRFDVVLRTEFLGEPHFDVVLNGIGPDGHVASLFPGHAHGGADEFVIAISDSPKPPPQRLSLTFAALNRGSKVWIVAAGADKADAISRLLSGSSVAETPASGLHGINETAVYLDEAAAALIAN